MMSTDVQKPEESIKQSIRLELQERGIRTLGDFVD
jgi:hypothetical protein